MSPIMRQIAQLRTIGETMSVGKDLKEARKELAYYKQRVTDLMAAYILAQDEIRQLKENRK